MNYKISSALQNKLSTSVLMTNSMQESIKLLQFSSIELAEYINQQLESNPFLFSNKDDTDQDNGLDEMERDNNYYNVSNHTTDDYVDKLLYSETFYESIIRQIYASIFDKHIRSIALVLLEYVDDNGYMEYDVSLLSNNTGYNISEIEHTLNILQNFEPSGVFARNLSECLRIQLNHIGKLNNTMSMLVDNLALIAKREFITLAKICNTDLQSIYTMVKVIKTLNPKPASVYRNVQNYYIKPDVILKKNMDGRFTVELNNEILPKVSVNRNYYLKIKNKIKNNEQQYLSEHLKNANILVRAVNNRVKTILKVTKFIVEYQQDFFERGVMYLKPLSLKNVADTLSLHESTISRSIAHKYISTSLGVFELKYFFSSCISNNGGQPSTVIKNLIKRLLEREAINNKKILSDQQITEILRERNIQISRRTVTKYRKSLNILSSSKRKLVRMIG
ncbi:MAG: RNA polymerase factor sigma-54 [Rickettsiales endosymbiont of Dermacentor nuttalli]